MFLHILKSKLKCVTVTDSNVEYRGSITLDKLLMDTAGIRSNERVEINAKNGSERIVSYAIEAPAGSGKVEMNGGAANFFKKGDEVHVNCFALIDEKEPLREAVVVYTRYDEENNHNHIVDNPNGV